MSVTLAEIEREVAARAGQYRKDAVASGTTTTLVCTALASSIELGGWENLYLLRRGLTPADVAIPGFASANRQRIVKTYDADTGTLYPDRVYTVAPSSSEAFELHAFDPEHELRVAVVAGLKRCYQVTRQSVTLTGAAAERNLTTLLPWITQPEQVYDVHYQTTGNLDLPYPVDWWRTFGKDGDVWLKLGDDPYPADLLITARGSVFDLFINSTTPAIDDSLSARLDSNPFDVEMEYAAAAGHIELWRICRYKMLPGAQAGLYPSQQECATEFTRQARMHFKVPPRSIKLSQPFGFTEIEAV